MTTRPACEACGAIDVELYQSAHAGWLCKDATACFRRLDASGATIAGVEDHRVELAQVAETQWVEVHRSGGTRESALPDWAAASRDIPDHPQEKVVIAGSGGRYAESWDPALVAHARALIRELAAMDPDFGKPSNIPGPTCEHCGGPVCIMTRCGWACDRCEPDYAALGYQETGVGFVDPDGAANVMRASANWIGCLTYDDAIQKDIRSDTDSA